MTNGVRAVLCVAVLSTTLAAQEPVLLSANMPIYPPLAAQARIEGIVKLTFTLGDNGEPMDIHVVSGHAQLKSAAVENVQTWRFKTPYAEGKYETEFDYRLARSGPKTVTFESFQRVKVVICPPIHSD